VSHHPQATEQTSSPDTESNYLSMHQLSTIGGPQVATPSPLPELTLTLTASQADTLEDALQTFAPSVAATIHPTMPMGDRARLSEGSNLRFHAHIAPDQLPQAVSALTKYALHIAPKSRAAGQIMQTLQGGNPT